MAVEIAFRGPILFVRDDRTRTVGQALIPNGETQSEPEGGKPGRHADGTPARRHFARVMVVDRGNAPAEPVTLVGTRVRVTAGANGGAAMDPTFGDVTPVDRVTNGPDAGKRLRLRPTTSANYWERVASVLTIEGGGIASRSPSHMRWNIAKDFADHDETDKRLPLEVVWTHPGDTATIQIADADGGIGTTITLDADRPRAIVYNFDVEKPTLAQLHAEHPCLDATCLDYDFNWLYQALVPPGASWAAWLGGRHFPAPSTGSPAGSGPKRTARGARAPRVSTCFLGSWSG